ncbi:MAG TPA: hypothetical protein VJC07_01195 [Candidatus Nanoarchaeia archaeon]|nr:hypothetical protein [Candidatus Nanoarchaeia archaeon]
MFETTKEKIDFLIVVAVLGFVFGFDDGSKTFDFGIWISNIVMMIVFAAIAVLVNQFGHWFVASRYGCDIVFGLWITHRYNIRKSAKLRRGFPIGILLSLILTLFSSGQVPFGAIWTNKVEPSRKSRFGRKYISMSDLELARIHAAGPIVLVVFALLLKPLVDIFPEMKSLAFVCMALAVATLIPFPMLAGNHVIFTSFTLWFVVVIFVIVSILANLWSSGLLAFILGVLLALIAMIVHVYYKHKPYK